MAKSYVFLAEVLREEDGRWSAGVASLPGCAAYPPEPDGRTLFPFRRLFLVALKR